MTRIPLFEYALEKPKNLYLEEEEGIPEKTMDALPDSAFASYSEFEKQILKSLDLEIPKIQDAYTQFICDLYRENLDKIYGNPLKIQELDTDDEYSRMVANDIVDKHGMEYVDSIEIRKMIKGATREHWVKYVDAAPKQTRNTRHQLKKP